MWFKTKTKSSEELIEWNHRFICLLIHFYDLISSAEWSISFLIPTIFRSFYIMLRQEKNFAMKVLFVPFKNADSRKNCTYTRRRIHLNIKFDGVERGKKRKFIHSWFMQMKHLFWFMIQNILFLGRQKITWKEKEQKIELWLLF